MQITFIGGGNMASAIIAGLSREASHQLRVIDPDRSKLEFLQSQYGVDVSESLPAGWNQDDIVLLAVKPQQLPALCQEIASRLGGALLISIAAGIQLAALRRWLASERIIRAMPNTPAMVGKGVTGLYAPATISAADRQSAQTIMQATGLTVWLEQESGIDDITCVSGSGPAYVFYFIESMIEAAIKAGFAENEARQLVLATFDGAVELARQSPLPVANLRQNVMSKGGTTERAIARFEAEQVKAAIIAGAMDCRERSIEMGQQLSQD
ncbi:pyrroline-5-carboxylate reductase [Neisseriaceae bacterium TC5R-5]|nr:pyrroline-5-carboxylate reductase [Neisseriaceae bacterium TC5R-5]